jgi:uroporphyrinogen-III synthase
MTPPPRLPLAGLRVVVTRAAHQADATRRAFEAAGARVELLPLLEIVSPDDPEPFERAVARLSGFDWVTVTSPNAARALADAMSRHGWPEVRIASVGGATSRALRSLGFPVHREAAVSRAEGLAVELENEARAGAHFLLPQAADARPTLADHLGALGGRVTRVDAYAKRMPPDAPSRAHDLFRGARHLGWITFTSPSTAHAFAEIWGEEWPERRGNLWALSIGPVTSQALEALGVTPTAEAADPGDDGMVEAMIRCARHLGEPRRPELSES